MSADKKRIGLIGARGYTGQELLALLLAHPRFELAFASSRQLAGKPLSALSKNLEAMPGGSSIKFESIAPVDLGSRECDALVLALPNGRAAEYVAAVDQHAPQIVILDLSADHRFDDSWHYGLPELTRRRAKDKRRIANPGCYATAMQLALAPLVSELAADPCCFGVSGFSGAGSSPSERNDPAVLADNLLAYKPTGHIHEAEVSHQLKHPIRFMPHVAAFFRGIHLTVAATLAAELSPQQLSERFAKMYADEPLVRLSAGIPRVAANAGRHFAVVGGWGVGEKSEQAHPGKQVVIYATLDNLLKGAATQAVQNLNLAFGFAELEGIPDV